MGILQAHHVVTQDRERPEPCLGMRLDVPQLDILSKGRDAAALIIGPERARALVEDNPRAAINGKALQVAPPIPFGSKEKPKRSFFSRFFYPHTG